MTPDLLMLISGAAVLVSLAAMLLNLAKIAKDPAQILEGKGCGTQILSTLGAGFGTLILMGGFVWFLVEKYAGGQ